MTNHRKQLKHHQAELERLSSQLPDLKLVADNARKRIINSINVRADKEFYQTYTAPYSEVKSSIEEHKASINKLSRLIEWEDGISGAANNIKAAQK